MFSKSYLAGYLVLLQITAEVSWIHCISTQGEANSDLWNSHEENTVFNLNKINSNYSTNQNVDPEENRIGRLMEKDISLNDENKNLLNKYYNDLNHLRKRNAYVHHGKEKRKHLMKLKKLKEVNIARSNEIQRKNKVGQSKIKLNKVKSHEYQGTSSYESNKRPFKDNKSKYNSKYGVGVSYKNSKTTQISNENTPKKPSVFDRKEETAIDKDSIVNITDGSYKDKNGNYKGNNFIASVRVNNGNNVDVGEDEQMDKEYVRRKNPQHPQHESGNSENRYEYTERERGHKLKRKHVNKQTDKEKKLEDVESSNQESKPHISNMSKTKQSVQHLSEIPPSSVESGLNFEYGKSSRADTSLLSVPNKNHIQQQISHTQNVKDSGNDEFDESKHTALTGKSEQSKHGQNLVPNHISLQNNNYGLRNIVQRTRLKKKASLKARHASSSDSDREYYDSNRKSPIGYSNLDIKEGSTGLKHAKQLSSDTANKRNQRDIKKRLDKHNNYKNHMVEDGKVFSYMKNTDDNEDLNVREEQKGQDFYNAIDDDNSEQRHRKFDVNSNNNDKYSYKESFEEENESVNDEEDPNNNNKRKKTFPRQSHETRQKGESKEKCVGYKAEKGTKKPTPTIVNTTEKCTTKGTTYATKRTTIKTTTTQETCNKSLATKKIESENKKNSSNIEALDIFEKYLCGQLADDFVDAVMEKVKRSRKIYKELGFRSDSEESCDRCIETKPNKLPDKETMKMSMGKCLKNNEHKLNCYMCYSVPKPMEKALNLLVLFEKEHENSVYNKIRDDSSFIFTGDYPEQFSQNDNSVGKKYTRDRDSFSKETFDKQDLREDSNEEKHDERAANRNSLEDDYTSLEAENKHVEYSTEAEVNKNEDIDEIYDPKLNDQNDIKDSNIHNKDQRKSSIAKEKDKDELDMNVEPRSKYSSLKGPETDNLDDSFDRASIKQRRKAFKSDKVLGSKSSEITLKDLGNEAASSMESRHIEERNLGYNDVDTSKERYEYENQHVLPEERGSVSNYDTVRQIQQTPYNYIGHRWPQSGQNKLNTFNYLSSGKFSPQRNNFRYPSGNYNDEGQLLHSKNNGRSVANSFISTGWDTNEYQLMPKQSGRDPSKHDVLNSVPSKRYYNDYEDTLSMVKRESEPSYEDEPLLLEIPNIEYDLY